MRFITSCVSCPGPEPGKAINEMKDDDRMIMISRRAFLQHVDRRDLRALEESLSYESHPSRGLTMAGDWHVSYHRSRFRGRLCYYFTHSAIEYIFTERVS